MSTRSFEIKNSEDFLQKLLEDYRDFEKDMLSSRLAINCAMTAWHLTDWIYHEFFSKKYKNEKEYQEHIKTKCGSLKIMHDITNGSKHYKLRKSTEDHVKVKSTELSKGSFDRSFSRDFDISTLDIEMKDGSKVYFEDEIKKVIEFWKDYFKNELKILVG